MISLKRQSEQGYVLVGVLILLSLALVLAAGMIDSAASNSKTRALVNTQADYYYESEETLNRLVAWLQSNSKNIVTAFINGKFADNFDTTTPTLGSNEGEHFGVPTMVKMKGTNSSAMLSNNAFFGESSFPSSNHLVTGASFDAVSAFRSADLGEANARVILTWARHTDGNYEPIFRADVITGNNPDRGVHSFSYVFSQIVATSMAAGFYGRDYVSLQTPLNNCRSYQYTDVANVWKKGAPRSNCPVASEGPIDVASTVFGTAKTNLADGVTLEGGAVTGEVCEGPGCHTMALPIFHTWDTYCPGNTNDVVVNSDTTLDAGGCFRDIAITNKNALILTDYEHPYYIRTLNFLHNFAKFTVSGVPAGEKVVVYVESLGNDRVNGNQFYNPTSAPNQLVINYIGTTPLVMNGTADINCQLVAPKVNVTLNGDFNFYGGIVSQSIDIIGVATLNYDEGLLPGPPVVQDLTFSLKKASQRYR